MMSCTCCEFSHLYYADYLHPFNAHSMIICVTGLLFIIQWINLLIFIARIAWLSALI